jgi:hypothetical protein
MSENADKAVTKVEQTIKPGSAIDDHARTEIDAGLKNLNTTQDRQEAGKRLEQDHILPTMLMDQTKQDELFQKYSTDGGKTLDGSKLREASENPNESATNRFLAQAIYDRQSKMEKDGQPGTSRAELNDWANTKPDASGNTTKVEGDPNNPTKVSRTNVNGESETLTRGSDGKYTVNRTNADGSTMTGEASNVKANADGSYSYETSGAKVEQKADGSRVTTNKDSGDVTTVKYDDQGRVASIQHDDKSGRLSETITSDGKNPPTYTLDINGGQGGHFNVTDVNFKGDAYSYKDEKGNKYEQETERDARTSTSADGKTVTRYNFGKDGAPTYIGTTITGEDGSSQKSEIKQGADGKYTITGFDGKQTEIQQPSVWAGGYSFKTADGSQEMAIYSDGTRKQTEHTDDGDHSVTQHPDGSGEIDDKSKDGTKTKHIEMDADGTVKKIEDNNGTTTTTIASDGNGGYTKTTHTNDGSKEDETVPVSDVALKDGQYSYKQEVGEHGRKFTFNSDGTVGYDVVSGDNLWSISQDLLTAQLGRAPNNSEIWAMINGVAQANDIKDPNLIYPDQQFKMPTANA